MNLKTLLRRLLCLHEWTIIGDDTFESDSTGRPIRIVFLRCAKCGKTSIHRIR
jgi:hypothetical protein